MSFFGPPAKAEPAIPMRSREKSITDRYFISNLHVLKRGIPNPESHGQS
jgi:hypothetical protein